jgi:outer membrane lipoprotein-sorting protein
MKKIVLILALFLLAFGSTVQALTAEEVLLKLDQNMVLDQAVTVTEMTIHGRSGSRTIRARTWIKGRDKAFVEYLSPAREKGKKMLKIGNKIWNYTPEPNDRIITISGHLLKQSVMGSDLSYEDMTENDGLTDIYQAKIVGREEISGRDCLVLELTAKTKKVTYHSRKIWVDSERWLPLKEERFARSGRLLKKTQIIEVFQVEGRWYPKKMVFKDMLSKGKGTEYIIESIDFNVKIPDYKMTKAALRK